jgi:hypothetical protein
LARLLNLAPILQTAALLHQQCILLLLLLLLLLNNSALPATPASPQ